MAVQTWRRGALALAAGVTTVAIAAPIAQANGSGGGGKHRWDGVSVETTPTVVSDNLNNPRQIVIKRDTVYVAEAGTGGTSCIGTGDEQACIGFTGSVTRVGPNDQSTRIQTGLLSVNSPEGDVVGVDSLTFRGNKLFGIATGACALDGAPAAVLAQAGKVLRLDGGTSVTAVGDVSGIECTTDPDGQGADTDPYGIVAQGDRFFVADAAGNDVVKVKNGVTTVATVLSKTGQPVPTSLAIGPDGALYIGTLNFEAGPGGAAVYRLAKGSNTAEVYAAGLSAITGIAFDEHGTLYVSEFTKAFGPNGPSPDGDVVAIPWGGSTEGRTVIGAGSVHFPGGVGVDSYGNVYVSNWSILPGNDVPGSPFPAGAHGQLLRFDSFDDGRGHHWHH